MPKISCSCGALINISDIPCSSGFKITSESFIERWIEKLVQMHNLQEDPNEFAKKAFLTFHSSGFGIAQAYECQTCGRLLVFRNASDTEPLIEYARESLSADKGLLLSKILN